MSLPLPTVPATVYAPSTQVASADLNDFETFMAAVKAFIEAGLWTRPDLADSSPVLATTDRDGRVRSYAGPEGFWMGPAIDLVYMYSDIGTAYAGSVSNQTLGNGLSGSAAVTTTVATDSPTDAPVSNFPKARIQADSGSQNDFVSIYTAGATDAELIGGDLDDVCCVMECRVALSHIGGNEIHAFIGLHSSTKTNSTAFWDEAQHAFCMFEKQTGDTNWQLRVADGTAGTDVDSGTPPVANTWQTLRLEYHGANTPIGVDNASATVRFFIDGTLEAETADANVPAGAEGLGFVAKVFSTATGPGANTSLFVSPIKVSWNMELVGDIPA